jgi:multidrug efflux pump
MALAIATGFVVDDAIVVIENISRHLEQGMRPFQASLLGAKEIGFTVLSMSSSLVAVFIPILLMGGIVGRLFREFAVTLSAAIGVSMIVSLTTTPMMCARLLKGEHNVRHGWLYRANERVFNGILRGYEVSLGWVMRHQFVMLLVTLGTVAFTVYLYTVMPRSSARTRRWITWSGSRAVATRSTSRACSSRSSRSTSESCRRGR